MRRLPKLRDLRIAVTIERLQQQEQAGAPTVAISVIASAWAAIEPIARPPSTVLDESPLMTHQIMVRLRQPLSTDCRIRTADGRLFRILHVRRCDEDSDLQSLTCEERLS